MGEYVKIFRIIFSYIYFFKKININNPNQKIANAKIWDARTFASACLLRPNGEIHYEVIT